MFLTNVVLTDNVKIFIFSTTKKKKTHPQPMSIVT